ncbi:MAG: hypothetical protein K9G76_11305 [Bacteroidales bacterium]|nr:hypothetical protein [Bacteroidales bacterium]
MKMRSLITILVVAFALFFSSQLISQDDNTSVDQSEGTVGGGGHTSDVQGIFIPD